MLELARLPLRARLAAEIVRAKLPVGVDSATIGQRLQAARDSASVLGVEPVGSEVLQGALIGSKAWLGFRLRRGLNLSRRG